MLSACIGDVVHNIYTTGTMLCLWYKYNISLPRMWCNIAINKYVQAIIFRKIIIVDIIECSNEKVMFTWSISCYSYRSPFSVVSAKQSASHVIILLLWYCDFLKNSCGIQLCRLWYKLFPPSTWFWGLTIQQLGSMGGQYCLYTI